MRHLSWVLLVISGCASPMQAVREDNRRLNDNVDELRADRRAQDRKIRDLEHQLALAKEKQLAEGNVPQLPVEVVAPPAHADGQRVIGVADDGTEIVYEGDAALGKAAMPESYEPPPPPARVAPTPTVSASDRLEVTRRVARPPVARVRARVETPVTTDGAAEDYRAAVELVKSGKLEEAIAALRAFVQHYPRHEYADNAQYWLGEAFYAQKDYAHALVEFRATIETYPRGNKVPDALLKVGYCYYSMGKADKARAVLEQVVNLYPKTEPALLAAKRLETP